MFEVLFPSVISLAKFHGNTKEPQNKPNKAVDMDNGDVSTYLRVGWRSVLIVNSHKETVRSERGGTRPIPPLSIVFWTKAPGPEG